jgi:hypothetical protein
MQKTKKSTWEVDLSSATTKTLGKEAPPGKWLCRVQQPNSLPSASMHGTRQRIFEKKIISLPSASIQGTRQRIFEKKQNSLFAECLHAGYSAKRFKKTISLPSASLQGTRQSIYFLKNMKYLPSASSSWHSAKSPSPFRLRPDRLFLPRVAVTLKKVLPSARQKTLGKDIFADTFFFTDYNLQSLCRVFCCLCQVPSYPNPVVNTGNRF